MKPANDKRKDQSKHQDQDEALLAVGPIDGRYRSRTRALVPYFSEYALIRYRVRVEIEWLLSLAANPAIDAMAPLSVAMVAAFGWYHTSAVNNAPT